MHKKEITNRVIIGMTPKWMKLRKESQRKGHSVIPTMTSQKKPVIEAANTSPGSRCWGRKNWFIIKEHKHTEMKLFYNRSYH